jgi:hypothetical protein
MIPAGKKGNVATLGVMTIQKIRLETKDGVLVAEVTANGEPDAILFGVNRVFIRRPMKITELETYFEATTHQVFTTVSRSLDDDSPGRIRKVAIA